VWIEEEERSDGMQGLHNRIHIPSDLEVTRIVSMGVSQSISQETLTDKKGLSSSLAFTFAIL
jgi:hypothetical protein